MFELTKMQQIVSAAILGMQEGETLYLKVQTTNFKEFKKIRRIQKINGITRFSYTRFIIGDLRDLTDNDFIPSCYFYPSMSVIHHIDEMNEYDNSVSHEIIAMGIDIVSVAS